MFVVVSYDIVDDRRRNRLAELLKDYGARVQYSVFECDLEGKHFKQMVREALRFVKPEEDSLKIYHLCEGCVRKVETYGQKRKEEEVVVI